MEDIIKSIKATLYDRVTSPLYGPFIMSWLICNWEIPYVTIFVSEDKLGNLNKLQYITEYCHTISYWYLIWLPFISTALFILIIPFLSYGALWAKLRFDRMNHKIKNTIEGHILLTKEESLKLRIQHELLKKEFGEMLKSKDDKIKELESLGIGEIEFNKNELFDIIKNSGDNQRLRVLKNEIDSGSKKYDNDDTYIKFKEELLKHKIITRNDKGDYLHTETGLKKINSYLDSI